MRWPERFVPALGLVLSLLLAGCVSGVTLRKGNETVKCGPYPGNPLGLAQQERCISDYQRQGYERAPQ